MKLSGITNQHKIADAIARLYGNLLVYSDKQVPIDYSSRGGIVPINVEFSKDREFWWATIIEADKNKYWNPVGFGYPTKASIESSDCEFNCSLSGYNKAAALFAKDYKDNIYLLHSGKAGGSTLGTSIENFCNFYEGDRYQVLVDGNRQEFFIVSDINSNALLDNIIKYAKAIFDFKEDLKANTGKLK